MSLPKSKKTICIVLAVIVALTIGIFVALKTFNKNESDVPADSTTVADVDATSANASSDDVTNAPSDSEDGEKATEEDATDEDSSEKDDEKKDEKEDEEATTKASSLTKKEIIALYNSAANKVKTDAKKVTRNFKNTRFDTAKSVLPSAIQAMADPMIEKYVKDEVEPVHYTTKQDIIENYPAPKQSYSSKLTVNDVTSATCVDNGKEYVITLKLATCKNPTPGVKVGAACHIMDVSSIKASDSSMIKKFDAIYEGCVIKCKIDKATNHITWANFYTPFTIDAVINVLFSEVVTVAVMCYERDYTITY